ncbi:MAG: YihY family inner membrane protein [Phycisphaerales bacterium]|nr:YihY family inner membrane protein [Phycisphaerales bacterium]
MIAKRSNRTSRPPEAPAGIIHRFATQRAAPGIGIPRELAASLLSPSRWTVLSSQLPAMAAALAYRTIFGLIPVLVIGLMVIGAYAEEKEISKVVTRMLHFAGLDQVAVDSGSESEVGLDAVDPVEDEPNPGTDPVTANPPTAAPTPGAGSDTAKPTDAAADGSTVSQDPTPPVGPKASPPQISSQRLDEWIGRLVKQVRTIPFRTIGFVGLAALIYAAISMLVEIERAFNQIYRVPAGRSWWSRVTRYWTLLTLGSIGLFATFYATDAFISRIDKVQGWSLMDLIRGDPQRTAEKEAEKEAIKEASEDIKSPTAAAVAEIAQEPLPPKIDREDVFSLRTVLGYATTVLITTAFMTIIYSVVPNARVRLTAAISGAFVGALLWEAAKWAFTFYVKSAGYTKLYGALALLPLFLLWVYVAWLIVLFGLFISYSIQTRGARSVTVISDGGKGIIDPASILLVAGAVGRQFRGGKSVDAEDAAKATGLEQGIVVAMLEAMAGRGLLHRVMTGDDEARFALARPPEMIPISECLAIGDELCERPSGRALPPGADVSLACIMRPLEQARDEAMKDRTLADFLGLPCEPAPSTITSVPSSTAAPNPPNPPASPVAAVVDRPPPLPVESIDPSPKMSPG